MRLGIRLECFRKPDFGWRVAMIVDQGLKRLSWSVPRMLVWNAMLEAANGLECRAELTENLRIVIFFFLQHSSSQSQLWGFEEGLQRPLSCLRG